MKPTIVTARVTDQHLLLVNEPLIASGGVDVIQIRFEFCGLWTGCGKTAVFYRDPEEVYHVPIADDLVTVPHEVLTDEGYFHFGVMGSASNIRTTEVVKVEVARGAITTATAEPEEPTPDIYQQLLAAYGKTEQALEVERARLDNLAKLEEGSTTGDAELADARIDYKGKTHSSAGAAIRGQASQLNEAIEKRLTEDEFASVFTKQRNEQLFDKDNATIVNGYPSGTTVPIPFVPSTMGHKCILQEVEPGKKYCVSRKNGMGTRFAVSAVASADDLTGLATPTTYASVGDRYCATITIPENAHYILVFYRHPNDTISEAENRANIKIEEGTTPTPGVAYYDYVATPNAEFPIDETVKYEPTRTIYLGTNILTNEPTKGTGWSGSLANGFTHAAGNSQRISFFSANIEFGETYICEFDTSYTADEFVTVGIGTSYRILAYNGTGHIRLPLKAIGTADADKTLYFYPVPGVNFTISNITLRKIQAKTPTSEEMTLRLDNVRSTAHNSNYGFWNMILGLYALENGVGSTRTLALGYAALKALQGGHRNIALGTFVMSQMTGGENNIGGGADAMLAVKQAEDNVVLGKAAAYNGANLKNNVVLGAYAMTGTAASVASNNVVIGKNAGWYLIGNDNTFLGYQAGYNVGLANGNTLIGKNAYGAKTGNHNTGIGEESGYSEGVNNSTAIGYQAKATKSNQMVLGGNNITETLCKGDLVVRGTDGVKRQIVFNADGTCTWVTVE